MAKMSLDKKKQTEIEKTFLDDEMKKLFLDPLMDFMPAFYADDSNNMAMIEILRAWLMPRQGRTFAEYDEHRFDLYDPTPENSFERAVSGMLSFHWSPLDKYFRMDERMKGILQPNAVEVDIEKALGQRTNEIHSVFQEPSNFQCLAVNARDKLGLGMAGREIEDDHDTISKFIPIPPEDIAVASSNGKIIDIFGKRERITLFQMRQRFPKTLIPDFYENRRFTRPFTSEMMTLYRFNFPYKVFREMILMQIDMEDIQQQREVRKVLSSLIGSLSEEESKGIWVDVWWCEEGVLSVSTSHFRRIIVSSMSPPYKVMDFSRGQGEKAISLMLQISELTIMSHSGFEKTYTPAWAVENDLERLGLDLGRNGITLIDRGLEPPKHLSLGADINSSIAFTQYKQALFDRLMYLDVFELLNKSRMTSVEVQLRDIDDFRKLGMYIVQDQFDDLNPTALAVNRQIHDRIGKNSDVLAKRVLAAKYTSALAFANKSNVFMKMDRIVGLVDKVNKASAMESEINDTLDWSNYLQDNIVKIGEEKLLRTEADRNERKNERARQQQAERNAKNTQSLANIGRTVSQIQDSQRAGGQPEGVSPGPTEPVGG